MPLLGLISIMLMLRDIVIFVLCVGFALWFIFALFWFMLNSREYLQAPKLLYKRLGIPAALLIGSGLVFYLIVIKTYGPELPETTKTDSISAGPFDMTSPQLKPFRAMYSIPRAKYGFTPLPKHASVTTYTPTDPNDKSPDFDTELDINDIPSIPSAARRVIYFKRVKNKYLWTEEREALTGPHQWKDAHDEMEYETIDIDYQTHTDSPDEPQPDITYEGNDVRLNGIGRKLTLKDVQPILKEWGAIK